MAPAELTRTASGSAAGPRLDLARGAIRDYLRPADGVTAQKTLAPSVYHGSYSFCPTRGALLVSRRTSPFLEGEGA